MLTIIIISHKIYVTLINNNGLSHNRSNYSESGAEKKSIRIDWVVCLGCDFSHYFCCCTLYCSSILFALIVGIFFFFKFYYRFSNMPLSPQFDIVVANRISGASSSVKCNNPRTFRMSIQSAMWVILRQCQPLPRMSATDVCILASASHQISPNLLYLIYKYLGVSCRTDDKTIRQKYRWSEFVRRPNRSVERQSFDLNSNGSNRNYHMQKARSIKSCSE